MQYRELSRYCNSFIFYAKMCMLLYLIQVFLCLFRFYGQSFGEPFLCYFTVARQPCQHAQVVPCTRIVFYPFHVLLRAVKVTINDVGGSCVDIGYNICRVVGSGYFVRLLYILLFPVGNFWLHRIISCRFSILGLV